MRQYDIAFGLGVGCGVSISIRDAGVQYLSLPFDWIGCNDPARLADIAAGHFRDWMRFEDLEITDVRIVGQSARFVVKNCRTGLLAPHDFSAYSSMQKQYPAFAELERRKHEDRFGVGGPLARMIARLQFRTYKKLQKSLERKGVIPGERPMAL